jgi:hypothetical protein
VTTRRVQTPGDRAWVGRPSPAPGRALNPSSGVIRPKVEQATEKTLAGWPRAGSRRRLEQPLAVPESAVPISTRQRTSHLGARNCARFHSREILFHRSKDFRTVGAAHEPREWVSLPGLRQGPPKHIWPLTDPGQKHSFNNFQAAHTSSSGRQEVLAWDLHQKAHEVHRDDGSGRVGVQLIAIIRER